MPNWSMNQLCDTTLVISYLNISNFQFKVSLANFISDYMATFATILDLLTRFSKKKKKKRKLNKGRRQ